MDDNPWRFGQPYVADHPLKNAEMAAYQFRVESRLRCADMAQFAIREDDVTSVQILNFVRSKNIRMSSLHSFDTDEFTQ